MIRSKCRGPFALIAAALLSLLLAAQARAVQPNDPKQEMIDKLKFIKKDIDKTQKQIDDLKQDAINGLGEEGKAQYDKDVGDAKDLQDAYNKQFSETQEAMDKAKQDPTDKELEKASEKAQNDLSELAQKKMKLDDKIKETMEKALEKLNAKKKKALADLKQHLDDLYREGYETMDEYKKYTGAPPPIKIAFTPPDLGEGESITLLAAGGQAKVTAYGTGETIGHIADLVVENLTDETISCLIPPVILESNGGQEQDYACPEGESIDLPPHRTTAVPMNGVCLVRSKPPVGKGVSGKLAINDGDPTGDRSDHPRLSAKRARHLLRIAESKYKAAEKLQHDGALKKFPYYDKQQQEDILVQWSIWTDARVSEGGPPAATKEDLKKVVYKQIEEHGPMAPGKKKKVDEGIDTIFEKIELTTEKAKDLEKPEERNDTDTKDGAPPTVGHSDTVANPATIPRPTLGRERRISIERQNGRLLL